MKTKFCLLILFLFISIITFSQTRMDTLQQKLQNISSEKVRLRILDTLTEAMVRANHTEQAIYLDQVITLAKELGDYDLAASKTRFVAQNYMYNRQSDSAIYIIEALLKDKSLFKKKSSEAHLLLKRGGAYFNKEQLEEASVDYDTSAELFLESGDSIFVADARFFGGQVYTNRRDFVTAVNRFEEAHKLYDILGDTQYANYALNELAGLYGRNGFHDKAIFERKRVLQQAKGIKDYGAMAYAYSQLASGYFSKQVYETSKKYADSLTACLDNIPKGPQKIQMELQPHKTYIAYYLQKGDLEKTKFHLDKIEKLRLLTDAPEYYETIVLSYEADYYIKTKQYDEAQKILKQVLAKKGKIGDINRYINAEKQMAELYAIQGDYRKAYDHVTNHLQSKDSLSSEIKTNTFLYYQSQFETERKDNEIYKKKTAIEILEKNQQIANGKRRVLWIVILVIIIVAAGISYYIWQTGQRKRKALSDKIKQNKKELDEFTSQLLDKSKVQETLTKELEALKNEVGEKETIQKLQDLTNLKILTPDDWYTFKHKFMMVYPTFFSSLKKKNYDLTKSEERLLVMEKLDLSTNEIANMLAISQDSVIRSRSRLRKKINAPKGSSILQYLEAS